MLCGLSCSRRSSAMRSRAGAGGVSRLRCRLLRSYFIQQWFKFSDPAMEEVLRDVPVCRDYENLSHWDEHITSESSILQFGHLLQYRKLTEQMLATVMRCCKPSGCNWRLALWWMPR